MRWLLTPIAFVAVTGFGGIAAHAATVLECEGTASAAHLAEPWEDNTQTFANGAVRIALLDALEPVSQSIYLLVLHPPIDEQFARRCHAIGWEDGKGFSWLDLYDVKADEQGDGLTLGLLGGAYNAETDASLSVELSLDIDFVSGTIETEEMVSEE